MLVLDAFCLKSCRSLARNARFGVVILWWCACVCGVVFCGGVFGGGVVMFLVWCFYGGVFVVVVFGVVFR